MTGSCPRVSVKTSRAPNRAGARRVRADTAIRYDDTRYHRYRLQYGTNTTMTGGALETLNKSRSAKSNYSVSN